MDERPANRPKSEHEFVEKPTRGYRWEPFKPGNKAHWIHGAKARDIPELAAEISENVNHLEATDHAALLDFCIAQIRVWRLASYIEREGELNEGGEPRPALKSLREWLATAERARSRLGFDPVSRASLVMTAARTRVVGEALSDHLDRKYKQ